MVVLLMQERVGRRRWIPRAVRSKRRVMILRHILWRPGMCDRNMYRTIAVPELWCKQVALSRLF